MNDSKERRKAAYKAERSDNHNQNDDRLWDGLMVTFTFKEINGIN